jgi:hypothetical protein
VVDAETGLEEMGERTMAHVMNQGRGQEGLSSSSDLGVFVIGLQVFHHLRHQMEYAEGVNQSVMIGSRESQIAYAKLVDATESLDFGAVQDVEQPTVFLPLDTDVVVEWITDDLRGH